MPTHLFNLKRTAFVLWRPHNTNPAPKLIIGEFQSTYSRESAVAKRIKEAIDRIADVIPPLGCHLAARIRTGYFCSYNPRPDRPVAWKF